MSDAEKTVRQVQSSYFTEEPASAESASEYVSARSPDTWRSTSISGVEDWCSVGSEQATLDDFKSIDDDLAEEYISDDNIEDLPLNGQQSSSTKPAVLSNVHKPATPATSPVTYAAVSGIHESKAKKYMSTVQPVLTKEQYSPAEEMFPTKGLERQIPTLLEKDEPKKDVTGDQSNVSKESDSVIAVSPKLSSSYQPTKYSSIVTKSEATEIKSEVKKSYEFQTVIKPNDKQKYFTSQKAGDVQTSMPTEKIHKVTLIEESQRGIPKLSLAEEFPQNTPLTSNKAELLSELEGLKSKFFKKSLGESHTYKASNENKSDSVSYGVPSSHDSKQSDPKSRSETSKVVYSKEVTESHSMTSISFQQQSFGINRSEKWQSVTPQLQLPSANISPQQGQVDAGLNEKLIKEMKESKEWIQLKIQEMYPSMTDIGTNLQEAADLHQKHEQVLEKLQTKQSPVEELLKQADDLISTQKPRGEVYSAMAENLGLAWKDLNAQLEQRRHILEQAVVFFTKANFFAESLDAINKSVSETFLPNTVESTSAILNRLKEERKTALTNSMRMLSEGQLLLERLCEVATHSMGDSRPQHMQHSARETSSFVERYMERLQDRWRHLESLWTHKKNQLEQCLLKCQLELQLTEGENWLKTRGLQLVSNQNLGDSVAGAEILLHEHHKTESESKEKQESFLKLVKTAEDLHQKGNYAGEELRSRAYHLLSECAELVSSLEQRRQLLLDSVNFFTKAQTAQTKLDQIEIQLSTSESPVSFSTVEDSTKMAIQAGRLIISSVGMTEPGVQGIVSKVEELERKRRKLSDVCKAKESVASEKHQAFRKFCEKYDELMKWLSNNGQFLIQRTRDMGSTQTTAKAFLDQHETLQQDLRMKMLDVEALLRTVPNLVRTGGEEAEVVHSKSDNLKQQFSQLRTSLEKRITIAQRYLAVLKLSLKVTKEMDELENLMKLVSAAPDQSKFRCVEEKQLTMRQELLQLNNNGKNFLEDARKIDDMFLNMSLPCTTVEDILSRLEQKRVLLNTQWLNLQNDINATKETLIQWEQIIKESNKVVKSSYEIDSKIFPVIPYELSRVESILPFLESRSSEVLQQIKTVQKDVDLTLKKCETTKPKESCQKEQKDLTKQLNDMNQLLQKRQTDYQILVSMMTTFFKNYEELEKLVEMQESQFRMTSLPNDVVKMEAMIHEHEAARPTVSELFKYNQTEAQQLINKINDSEPPTAAAMDREKISSLLSTRKLAFEKSWEEFKYRLEQHNQLCIFFRDMHLINKQIEDLNAQLTTIRESYGESLPSALLTSEAFLQFEKTIELLQIRIYEFVSTAERLMRDQRVDSGQIHQEIDSMQKKWSTFRTEVTNNRKLIDVAIEYYKVIEESEEWLKEGSSLLISIARKSSTCTKDSDAENLKQDIKSFLDRGRPKQEGRIRKISTLSQQLFGHQGHPSLNVINNKNKDMMDSFSVITSELNTLSSNIKVAQQVKIVEQKGKEEIDAALHAAQAEAEAARLAAATALQAAKAAAKAVPPKPVEPAPKAPRFVRNLIDAEVREGTKFTFECEVEGIPTPQVQWFKDGIIVENNPDYQTSSVNGICKLTIEETFSEDTAKFTCRAVNSAGVAETQSQLVVKESRTPSELIPPHFVQEPLDSIVKENESHQLECQVFGNPLPLVSWFKDDVCIDYSTDYSITYNNGFCSLKIEEVSTDHQGRYTCRAVNQVGQVACSANIQVQTTSPSERPFFVSPLSNVMARAGQKLRLECSVTGQPEPQVTWLHNSKSIKETRDTKLHFDGRNATLVITEAFPKDAGTYTIIARNKVGEAVSSCNVSVKGRLPMETSDSEIASDIEPAKPQVKQQLEDQTVFEGKKVRMDCVIVGQPEPEVIWYHNGKPVKESDDFQLLFEGDRCTLIIETAYLEDGGTYKCVAINSGGEASSVCQLIVKPADVIHKSQFEQKDILLTVEKYEPPKFLKLLDNVIIAEGEAVTLECQIVGESGTSVAWFKDGTKILNCIEHQLMEENSGVHRLHIPSAKITDRGTYSIKAQNKAGDAQSICSVFVTPSGPVVFGQTPKEVPPIFLQHVENQVLPLGATACFETVVDGSPKPKVRWNFMGKPVPKDVQHDIGSDEYNKYWLIVKDIKYNNVGRYSAIAENNSGIATTSALLNLDDYSVAQPPMTCEEQRAQSMIMTKKKTLMQTSTISSMSELSDADYQLPDFPDFSSLQSQQLVKMEQSTTVHQSSPQSLIPSTKSTTESFIVKKPPSVNDNIVLSTTQVLSTPPKFSKPVSTEIINVGEKLLLEAYYEGEPEPVIQWFKDELELKNSPCLQITSGKGRTSVFIPKSSESDGGRYACIASNTSGKATSMAEVRVKPIREAPKFKKKFEAAVVRSGCKVIFEVEVTGIPTPEVRWFRNGAPLQDSPDFRISTFGNRHTLLINEVFPDDSGTFMAVASNIAGEARCSSDLIVEEEKSPDEEKHISYEAYSSISQTKQMYTKISSSEPIAIKPYEKPSEFKFVPNLPEKVLSPPPMPAVSPKIWNQTKPTPFPAPAITEAVESIPIPSPEPEEVISIEHAEAPATTDSEKCPISSSVFENIDTPVRSGFPLTTSMSESFVRKSVMKFSQPDVKEKIPPTIGPQSVSKVPLPVQNGFDSETKPSHSISQSTFISESRSFTSTGTISSQNFNVPKATFVPKAITPFQSGTDTTQSRVPVWQPKKIPELISSPQKFQPTTMSTLQKSVESVSENAFSSKIPSYVSESKSSFISENKSTSCDLKNDTSTASCQTSSEPGFYSTESSSTRTSTTRTEEISITKKYELVLEHSSETMKSTEEDKPIPKPIIKKEVSEGPKVKKEVVIEEEPVLGAEVKPPLFSKVRGADSFRKIYTDV